MSAAEALEPPSAGTEYQETLEWLFGTQLFGIKLGLENIQRLLNALEVPAPEQQFIHVAGTNGKGSVCAMIEAICRAGGYRTGLFTSPHLVTYRERIQVNGEMIPAAAVTEGLTMIRELVREWKPHPTFFEITTALALWHFRRSGCEIVVLETGMGGRLDATNALQPIVSIITPIGLDHQKWLGSTLPEIAAEKAGIIKRDTPVVSATQPPEAEEVIRRTAAELNAPLQFVSSPHAGVAVALSGVHQRENAALAVAALRAGGVELEEEAIASGLGKVQWPARFQRWNDRIVIDGAHNPAGAEIAAKTWRELFGGEKAALVLGMMRDKDAGGVYRALAEIAEVVILPQFRGERVVPPTELQEVISAIDPAKEVRLASSCAEALQMAQETPQRVLVAGSLHLAGEALAVLSSSPSTFEECAQ